MTQQTTLSMLDQSIEVEGSMVNLTKMCEANGKRLDLFMKSKNTKAFIEALSELTPNGGSALKVATANNSERGTFGSREIALKLAQWISPQYEVYCIGKLRELFETGTATIIKPQQKSEPKALALKPHISEEGTEAESIIIENYQRLHNEMDSEAYNDDLEDVILFMRITNTKYIDILAKEGTIRRVYPEMSNSCIEVILQDIKSVKESYENLMGVTNFENKVNMLKIKNGNRKINKNIKTSMSNRFSLKR